MIMAHKNSVVKYPLGEINTTDNFYTRFFKNKSSSNALLHQIELFIIFF